MVWWRIDPQTGEPTGEFPAPVDDSCVFLLDEAVDAAGDAATAIGATFGASRHFPDDEVRRLLAERVLPASVRPWPGAAAELLDLVDDLWQAVDRCSREASGRPATSAERHWLCRYAHSLLRPGGDRG
jgi:hypothetical protein